MGSNSKAAHQSYAVTPALAGTTATVSAGATGPSITSSQGTVTAAEAAHTAESAEVPKSDPAPPPTGTVAHLPSGPEESAPDEGSSSPDELPPQMPAPTDPTEPDPAPTENSPPGDQPLTPIPDTPEPGRACGEAVLVGGEDLHASTATLISYLSPDGPRTVLHAVVSEEAEAKLLEALHLSTTKMIPVQVEQTVHGRLPLDHKHKLFEALLTAAKSVNHHVNNGTLTATGAVPATTQAKIDAMAQLLGTLKQDLDVAQLDTADKAMVDHYTKLQKSITDAAGTGTPVEHVTPHLHEGTAMVTTYKPAPSTAPPAGMLVAAARNATRIQPTIDPATGQASWDGITRNQDAKGVEYVVELADGYSAVYRPYDANDPAKTDYSLRGRLEIIAPAGQGHGPELVHRLGNLHLTNQPMTQTEGEWSYLSANITAQQLGAHPEVAQAITIGTHMEDMVRQELFHTHAHKAIGLNPTQLSRFAKDLQLQAATQALPAKVGVLRDAVAKATGHIDGTALAATPGYDPSPRRSGGWLAWSRFDVGNKLTQLQHKLTGRSLTHSMGGGSLLSVLTAGVLASTERRAMMGTKTGIGMSETQDKATGGASSVFLRISKDLGTTTSKLGGTLVWDDPERLLARADYYGANYDSFGVINPAKLANYGDGKGPTRDPFTIASFTGHSNEVMFRDGIDLLGAEAPTRIICHNTTERDKIRTMLAGKGITTLGGKPVDTVVIS